MNIPYILQCYECHSPSRSDASAIRCQECGGLLEVRFEFSGRFNSRWEKRPLSVWRYREIIPVENDQTIVSLGEGGTGLHSCPRLGRKLGLRRLFVKNEGENPTGSFKDRGMTVAISKARELKKKRVICASTGNTAASLAAYSARAGLQCIVFVPEKNVALGKMIQVVIHGAKFVRVNGDFDQALETVVRLSERRPDLYIMNSLNPFRLEGQKTLAFEICDQLPGGAPDAVILPVGNGGNISAAWKGFREFHELDLVRGKPRMVGIQAKNAAPIATAFKSQKNRIRPVRRPETLATAIRIGHPVNWKKALNAINESHGTAETVTDGDILAAQRELARMEGIFVEPASAASIAGLRRIIETGEVDSSDTIVCVTTGHGLKDPSVSEHMAKDFEGKTVDLRDLARFDSIIGQIP